MITFAQFRSLTRLEQTLFALPFVLSTFLLVYSLNIDISWNLSSLLVFPAFVLARIAGMAFNQFIDREIDAKNPRTKNRPLPSKKVTLTQAKTIAILSLAGFLFICLRINTLCFIFGCLTACLLFLYSYMKRIHESCHFVLGMIHFLSPVMTGVALTEHFTLLSCLIGLVAFFSISANDILYALNDYHFDCENGLYSIPAKYGVANSLRVVQGLRAACIGAMVMLGVFSHLPWIYFVAPLLIALFFLYLYRIPTEKLSEQLFFYSTVGVSVGFFIFTLLSVLWRELL